MIMVSSYDFYDYKVIKSNRKLNYSIALITNNEIVDEISIEDSLNYSCNKGNYSKWFPLINPNLYLQYQCKI